MRSLQRPTSCFLCTKEKEWPADWDLKYCCRGSHQVARKFFVQADVEYPDCNACRDGRSEDVFVSREYTAGCPFENVPHQVQHHQHHQHQHQHQHEQTVTEAPNTHLAIPPEDWQRLKRFRDDLDQDKLQQCTRCRETWFAMQLGEADRVCVRCRRHDTAPYTTLLLSPENDLDPGDSPMDLPKLSHVEQMLIARMCPYLEVTIGTTILYALVNEAKIHRALPPLIEDLPVLRIVSPPLSLTYTPYPEKYRVRRAYVEQWLTWLQLHHRHYATTLIDTDSLARLPEDGLITSLLPYVGVVPAALGDISALVNAQADPSSFGVVPSLILHRSQVDAFTNRQVGDAFQPYADWHDLVKSRPWLSLCFPCLFPTGAAESCNPRPRSVDYRRYLDHLLKFHDSRFARHRLFLALALLSLLHGQVITKTLYHARESKTTPAIDRRILGMAFAAEVDDVELDVDLRLLIRLARVLRGTQPFWEAKKTQLKMHTHRLGRPALFLTFSQADLHWDSLQKLLPSYELWRNQVGADRRRLAAEAVDAHPHIAAYHFWHRLQLFLAHVVRLKLQVSDMWYRFEWQSRGSAHCHAVVWLEGQQQNPLSTPAQRVDFAREWQSHISAHIPAPAPPIGGFIDSSGLSASPSTEPNTMAHLSKVVRQAQTHSHATYCRSRPALECRFGFPKQLLASAQVVPSIDGKFFRFEPARADAMIQQYNASLILAWLANMDISPCTSSRQVIEYVAKEAPALQSAARAGDSAQLQHAAAESLTDPAHRILARVVGGRYWTYQEICHVLLSLPLQVSTRRIVFFDCRPQAVDPPVASSLLARYLRRDQQLSEKDTLLQWLSKGSAQYNESSTLRPLICFDPVYEKNGPDHEEYCRVKMLLNHSFRHISQLQTFNGQRLTWTQALDYCSQLHVHPADDGYQTSHAGDVGPQSQADAATSLAASDDGQMFVEWCSEFQNTMTSRNTQIGYRDPDQSHDWSTHVKQVPGLRDDFWDHHKTLDPSILSIRNMTQAHSDSLNREQKAIYDCLLDHYHDHLRGSEPSQLLLQVDGEAGTGKSYLIAMISSHLAHLARSKEVSDPVLRVAPTGVAAHAVSGRTIHSLFRLAANSPIQDLAQPVLDELRDVLRPCRYLFVDEKSMLSKWHLEAMHKRCCQATGIHHSPFGGINVVLFGDFAQLAPVAAKPLFDPADAGDGFQLYQSFTRTLQLTESVRHAGFSDSNKTLRSVLAALRVGQVAFPEWDALRSRVKACLTDDEIESFKDALRIFAHNADVVGYNVHQIKRLDAPVLVAKATDIGFGTVPLPEEVGGLHASLALCVGCRVMLTENLWTERGLVNGALGTVTDIVWTQDIAAAPTAIFVTFDKYDGPRLHSDADGRAVVPIFRSARDFSRPQAQCRRLQFPLTVAYAVTVHKAQGLTLDKAVLDISQRDFTRGLTYVAVSRVRSLEGLMFELPFDLEDRFRDTHRVVERLRETELNNRLRASAELAG